MRAFVRIVHVAALAVLMPTIAFAQATITGTVKDTSGAVLPGVTVEVSSPALIEKTRSAVTDEQGRYTIIDLRPGIYSVTFSLSGFTTVPPAIRLPASPKSAGYPHPCHACRPRDGRGVPRRR